MFERKDTISSKIYPVVSYQIKHVYYNTVRAFSEGNSSMISSKSVLSLYFFSILIKATVVHTICPDSMRLAVMK